MAWDNAPSHICRGGDPRGLAFCCPPVKPCPVMNTLREIGLSPQEFFDIKQEFANETKLGEGAHTCFGSLVWCCKNQIGLSVDEYLTLKKQLSEKILAAAKKSTVEPNREAILALSATFDISEENAAQVLADCNNDLRLAVKTIKLNELEGQ